MSHIKQPALNAAAARQLVVRDYSMTLLLFASAVEAKEERHAAIV